MKQGESTCWVPGWAAGAHQYGCGRVENFGSGDAGKADREPVVDGFEWCCKDFALFPEGCGYFWY